MLDGQDSPDTASPPPLPGPMPQLRYRSFPAAETMAAMNDATAVVIMMESREAM